MAEDKAVKKGGCLKLGLMLAGGLVVLLIVAAIVVPMFIPWDKVKVQAEEKISATIHHTVTIQSLGFSLWRGIEVKKIVVANAKGFSAKPLLSADSAVVAYRLLPLLIGKVAIKAVVLEHPVLQVERNAKGVFNFSDMMSAKAAPAPEAAKPAAEPSAAKSLPKLPLELLVSRFAITEADLTYNDAKAKQKYEIEKLTLEVRNLSLAGLTPVHVTFACQVNALGMKVPITAMTDWRFQYAKEKFILDKLEAGLLGIALKARGTVDNVIAAPTLDISGAVSADFAKVLAGVAPMLKGKGPQDLKASGTALIDFKVTGPALDPAKLQVSVKDDIKAQVTAMGLEVPATLSGKLGVAGGDLELEQKLSLPGLDGQTTIKLGDFMQARNLAAKLTGRLNLAEAAAKLVPPAQAAKLASVKTQGRIDLDASVSGPLSAPKKMQLAAQVKASDISVAYAGKAVLEGLAATLTVAPDKISLPALKGKLGGQPIMFTFLARGFDLRLPETLKPDALKAQVEWSADSPLLDVDALLALMPAEKAAKPDGKTAVKAAAAPAPAAVPEAPAGPEPDARKLMPAGLVVAGKANLGGLKFGKVQIGKMSFQMDIKKRVLSENGSIAGYQGSISEKFKLDFSQPVLTYAVDSSVKTVDIEPLLNDVVDTFVAAKLKKPELVAELKDKFTGKLSGTIQIQGAGLRAATSKARLSGKGNFNLAGARMRKMAFQDALARLFNSDKFAQDIPFDSVITEFTMADQVVTVGKFAAESGADGSGGDIRIRARGKIKFSADFDDFRMQPALSPRSAGSLSEQVRQYSEVLKDEKGWVSIPVIMNGPVKKPDVQPDMDVIKQQAGAYAQKKAKAAAEKYIDENKGQLQEQLNKGLKGLFGR